MKPIIDYLLAKQLKLFPIQPGGKRPAFGDWQDWAIKSTREQIQHYSTTIPRTNWGVFTRNLIVVDVDNKQNRDGSGSWRELLQERGVGHVHTFTVLTPTGGLHYYYSGVCRNRAGLRRGVDIRGDGGFVVAPGSTVSEKEYIVQADLPIQPAPQWLYDLAREKEHVNLEADEYITEGSRNETLARIAGGMRANGLSFDEMLPSLSMLNETRIHPPLQEDEVHQIAQSICRYAPNEARGASDFLKPLEGSMACLASAINPGAIPKRDWVLAGRYIGGFVSAVVAPGGAGKSTLALLEALSVATGKDMVGARVVKPGPVWLYNTEDSKDEIHRRIAAMCDHHNLLLPDLDNVHITSGRDTPLILAKNDPREGVVVNTNAIDYVSRYILENKIVLFVVDPFVRSHEVQENDNMQIDKVIWAFQRIIDKTGVAVCLVHHTGKGVKEGQDAARGASSFINATRVAHTVTTMTKAEALKMGVAEKDAPWYLRMDNAKANLTPPAQAASWYRRVSVRLVNGDYVGALERAHLADGKIVASEKAMEVRDIANALCSVMEVGHCMPLSFAYQEVIGQAIYRRPLAEFKEVIVAGLSVDGASFTHIESPGSKETDWVKRCQ